MRRDLKPSENRAADVEVAERGAVLGLKEWPKVEISGDVARGVVVGEADQVTVVPADRVLNAVVGKISVGKQAGLAGEPVVQGEKAPLGSDKILFKVIIPIKAIWSEHSSKFNLKALVEVDIQVAVEQVPGTVDASLQGDFVLEKVGQAAFEVEPNPRNVEPATGGALVVGDEILEVGLVENVKPKDVFVVFRLE